MPYNKWILSFKKEDVKEEIEELFKLRDKFIEEHIEYFADLAKGKSEKDLYNIARHQDFSTFFIILLSAKTQNGKNILPEAL